MVQRIQYNATFTLSFVLLSFMAYGVGALTNKEMIIRFFSIYRAPITDPLLYIRLFTHVLGSYDFEHFANNAMLILLLGPLLEEKYGSLNMLMMSLITALFSALISLLFSYKMMLGASGIVFMFIVLSSFTNMKKGSLPLTTILIFVFFIGKEIMSLPVEDNISRLSHITGGLLGAVFGFEMNKS